MKLIFADLTEISLTSARSVEIRLIFLFPCSINLSQMWKIKYVLAQNLIPTKVYK